MSLPVFLFHLSGRGYQEPLMREAERGEADSGRKTTLIHHPHNAFMVESAVCVFPQPATGLTYEDLVAFWNQVEGPKDAFLYTARHSVNRQTTDDLGFGDGVKTDFYLTYRHPDPATLVVTVDGVTEPPGNYTLTDAGTDQCRIVFSGGNEPGAVQVYAYYERQQEVTFDMERLAPSLKTGSESLAVQGSSTVPIALSATMPGSELRVR